LVRQEWALAKAWPGGLAEGEGPDRLTVRGHVGVTAWISCAGVLPWGQSAEQGPDEAASLTYTWEPLEDELEILGHPVLRVRVAADAPVAYLSAKICDVFPDGSSSLVVRGMVNLAHRRSREEPEPLDPGVTEDIELELEACSWTFEPGHRVRIDLAGADWPNAWAPPSAAILTIDRDQATLSLPVIDGPEPVADAPELADSSEEQTDPAAQSEEDWARWTVTDDVLGQERRAEATYGGDHPSKDGAPSMRDLYGGTVGVSLHDPARAWAAGESDLEIRYPEATVRSQVTLRMDSDPETYRVVIDLAVSENGEERRRRRWDRTFPRDLQ